MEVQGVKKVFEEDQSSEGKETGSGILPLRRDNDSLDDFEHLEHDVLPVKDTGDSTSKPETSSGESPPRVVDEAINTVAESVANTAQKLLSDINTEVSKTSNSIDTNINNKMSTTSHLLDMNADFKADKTSADLLSDFSYAPPEEKVLRDFDNFKAASQSFMESEKEAISAEPDKMTSSTVNDLIDRFSDSEPELDDFKPSSNEEFKFSSKLDEDATDEFITKVSDFKPETFKDVIEEPEIKPELPTRDYFVREPTPESDPSPSPEPIKVTEVVKIVSEPEIETKLTPTALEPEHKPIEKIETVCSLPKAKRSQEVIGAEAMFCKMGLGNDENEPIESSDDVEDDAIIDSSEDSCDENDYGTDTTEDLND